ncbi:MAG: ribonuclease III [Alphaproteobacteria bacterium]|nr:ribonuclease III [Alphaproteobacteria bacterium]
MEEIKHNINTLLISKKQLKYLEDELQYTFKNKELLRNALRHSSIKKSAMPFERLEFLGDRILGVVIAAYIYRKTAGNEGEMAKMHSAFVCAESCYEVAIKLGVNNIIKTAGPALRNNKTVLADAMEAILGAIFIDSRRDYRVVEYIVTRLWKPVFKRYKEEDQEPKTQLQEIVQANTNEVPLYTLLSETGPKHHPIFTVSVTALGNTIQASGFSKKEAETNAAREFLKNYINDK